MTPKLQILSAFTRPVQWIRRLSSELNPSFMAGIFLVYGLNHGFATSYFGVVSDYYWKDVQKVRPASAQFYVGLYYIPWIMKPMWGLLTDVLPIFGYRRRPYLVAAGVIGVGSTAVLAGVSELSARWALVCMVGGTAGMAIASVTIDACIAKSSIEVRELAADLQSLCGVCLSFGALIGFFSSGFFVHWLGPQEALGLLAIPPAFIFVLGFVIYELRVTHSAKFSEKKVLERLGDAMENMYTTIKFPQVWKPALYMFLSLTLSFSTHEGHFYWYTDPEAGPGFSQVALGVLAIPAALLLVLGFVMYELRVTAPTQYSEKKVFEKASLAMESLYTTIKYPQVWKPSLFMFLSLALSFSTQEGYFYWYTNPQAGPGFSQEFVGMIYAIGAVGAIVGVLIYQRFLKDFPFRTVLLYVQVLYGISGMLDLVFVLRWNLIVGIPDSFFVIMEESVLHIISKVRWMPTIVLSTRLCPLGIEGTFFALLLCIDTLGWFSAKMMGGVALHLLHISRTDFTKLWLAVLIRNCLRISTLALIFLVPNATQYDVLVPPHPSTRSDHEMINEEQELALQLVPLNEKVQI